MIKLGVNSVLFRKYDFVTAAKYIRAAGYDGVEISAIKGMCEHLDLDRWSEQAKDLKRVMDDYNLEFLSTEVASLDADRLLPAFAACAALGIPIVNVGPGGKSDVEEDFRLSIDRIRKMAAKAREFGVTLCVKAHVGGAIYNTPTTLRAVELIGAENIGIDMDPSHIHRAGENPAEALSQVIGHVRHIHIRDCRGQGPGPGNPRDQACGRGDIDLPAYCRSMVDGCYEGPVCLEVIGPESELVDAAIIAAESYGYLHACLRSLGAR